MKPYDASPLRSIYRAIAAYGVYDPVRTQYAPNPAADVAVPASTADVDAANLKVTVRAPKSGMVRVELTGYLSMSGSTRVIWLVSGGVGSLTTSVVGQQFTGNIHFEADMTGLTPGTLYTLVWRHLALAGSTATMKLDAPNGYRATMKATPLR